MKAKNTIRMSLIAKVGYKCERCGIPHKSWAYHDPKGGQYAMDKADYELYRLNGYRCYQIHLIVLDGDLVVCASCGNKYRALKKTIERRLNVS